jgi:TP901 family phage tail tape measure protein
MAINVPLNAQLQNATQLQQQIQNAVNSVRINLGGQNGARALSSLSQPLGRLTGQADEFTKSLDAANARVLAFGASVGVVNAVTNAFKSLVNSTIEVEKAITAISVVGDQFTGKTKELSQGLFSIAKATGQSFDEVSKAALEFSRQGLNLEDTLSRTQDALVLTRLTGLDAAKSVDGLTAAVNAFSKAGLSTTQIINKLAAVDQAFAVSSADLIEGFNRSAAVAQNAGVTFDELAGIITALQQETSRGGAVIGNALKTIFTRLQDTSTLNQLQNLGIAVQDLQGNILPARQILQNLATDIEGLGQITKAGIFKDVAGTFQINQLISLVGDLNKENSVSAAATRKAASATNEAFIANEKLNQSLDAVLGKVANTGKQLGSILGELGLTDNLKGLLDGINSFLEGASNLLQGDDLGSNFAKGFVKGIGAVLSGPGLGIFLAIIGKLSLDLAKFGAQSLKAFFGIGKAAADQKLVQESIVQTLLKNQSVLSSILNTQGGQNAQALKFLGLLNQQAAAMQSIQGLAGGIASTVYAGGYRATAGGLQRKAAGGYLPTQEASDVRRGVGGASPSSKVVAIPNFAFGGGKRGTMIANTSEYIVPNYAGGGSAIFNQDMVKTMGLPPGAKKISAAGGFIPNFADATNALDVSRKYALIINKAISPKIGEIFSYKPKGSEGAISYRANIYGINERKIKNNKGLFEEYFSSDALVRKYTEIALRDASDYSSAVVGKPISPVAVKKLSNAGSIPSLVGAIFESGITAAIEDPELIKAQQEGNPNAPFDFIGTPKLNEFFGIPPSVPYVEAKYNDTPDSKKSFAGKIFKAESGITKGLQEALARKSISNIDKLKENWSFYNSLPPKSRGNYRNLYNDLVLDLGLNPTTQKDTLNKQINRALGNAASGYVPNFAAAALQQAIAREKSAGLSDSQIYVDQSAALKSPMNPMGLMVANRRDEPAGGFQGIARARKEGMNPKLYGAAGGFVPNLAAPTGTSQNINKVEKGFGDLAGKFIILQSALSFFEGGFTEAGSVANKFSSALQTAVSAVFAYQAIQQLSSKNQNQQIQTNTSLLKKASDGLKKFASDFEKGGGARAATVARGGKLPSSTPFATRFSAGLGTGKIAGGVRSFVGNPLGAIQSLGATALTATIALKSFNDIASLFYNRSSKLDSSLDLLSSSATQAASSLNDIDKASVKGSVSGLGGGAIASLVSTFSSLSPLSLGRESVTYDVGGSSKIVNLKGGQGAQDFKKIQEDLINLIFSNLRSQLPDAESSYLSRLTQNEISNLFAEATTSGTLTDELDLQKVLENPLVQELRKKTDEISKKIQITTSNIEFKKPVQQFKRTLEKIISDGGLVVENATKELERQSKLINAISSSKTFASLSDSSKLAFEINSASNQLTKELENRVAKFTNDAQSSLLSFIPELGASTETAESLTKSVKGLGNAKTTQDINNNLNIFSNAVAKAGATVDKSKLNELEKIIKGLNNGFKNLEKEVEVEQAVLALNNSEKLLEARAYDTYKSKLAGFVDEMIKGQTKLIQMRGDIDRINVKKQGDIEIATANARSSREAMILRQQIESRAFTEKQPKEQEILLQEKELAAKREFFTKDNIAGLNRNTEALNNLTRLFASDFINKIDAAIAEALRLDYIDTAYGQTASKKYKEMSGLGLPSEMTAPEALKYFQELKGVYSPSASLPMASSGGNLQTADKYLERISASIRGGSNASTIQAQIENFGVTPEMKLRFTEYANQLLEAYQTSTAAFDDKLKTLKDQQKTETEIFDATNSYASKLKAQIRALNDSLTDPQTAGEYASKLRQQERNAIEQGKGSDAERRAYRSSFGYGLSQGFEEVEKRTLDYKQELGVEIPRLFSSNLAQGLNDAISGAKSLKEALTDAATSFFQEITRKNISNLADLATSGFGSIAKSGAQALGFASGGMIKGGSGTKDDVPAMLMGGEYVMKKSAVNKYGKGFLDALNNGKMRGYATGGLVDPQTFPTQTGRNGFFTPGDYGQGAISGKNQLLTFASQSFTGGQYDYMGGFGMGGASVGLESESARLSAFGRENSPMFERVQQSKDEAFKVYLEGLQKEKEYAELLDQIAQNEKARKKQLQAAIISAVVSSAASYAGTSMKIGAANAKAAGGSAFKGAFVGSGGQGGAFNMFRGTGTQLSDAAKLASGNNSLWNDFTQAYPQYKNAKSTTYTFSGGAYRASGGLVSGGSNIRDDVPTMLTGGEFVLNNRATQRIGLQNLNKLNNGQSVGGEGASAEMTQALISKLDELIQATQNSSSENVVVNVSSNEAGGQNQENPAGAEKELHKKIRQAVLDVIAQEQRLGGSLEKSR